MPMTESKRALASSICAFLQQSIDEGSVSSHSATDIQQAITSISAAFGADGVPATGAGLEQIYAVYEKTQKSRNRPDTAAPTPATTTAETKEPSAEDVKAAESFKSLGNAAMTKKDYKEAVTQYSKALDLVPRAKVYLSNRAAAYSSLGEHELAVRDARKACDVDPSYGKAWSRLGHALYVSGDVEAAKRAYEQGCTVDPGSEIMKRGLETCSRKLQDSQQATTRDGPTNGAAGGMPDLAAMANMFGGAGAGGGGMPDMSAMMSNPAFMSMAQNLMQSGALEGLLNNPRMAQMAEQMQQGGGMPDVQSMMQDPEIRNMAENFGRNMGLDPAELRRQQQQQQHQNEDGDP